MTFSDKLRQLRKENGISQIKLAQSIGVSDRNLRRYEKNEIEPPLSVITAIADFFQISVDYLLGRSDGANPPLPANAPFDLPDTRRRQADGN